MARSPANNVQNVPHVPGVGQRWLRRGVRLPSEGDGEDVRLQEVGEEAHQEAEGRIDGAHREANSAENQLEVRGESGIRLRDEGCAVSSPNDNERFVHTCRAIFRITLSNNHIR